MVSVERYDGSILNGKGAWGKLSILNGSGDDQGKDAVLSKKKRRCMMEKRASSCRHTETTNYQRVCFDLWVSEVSVTMDFGAGVSRSVCAAGWRGRASEEKKGKGRKNRCQGHETRVVTVMRLYFA